VDQETQKYEIKAVPATRATREFPTGWVVAFSGVFVLGFAVIAGVLMTRRKPR
jgi:hypothetical protein